MKALRAGSFLAICLLLCAFQQQTHTKKQKQHQDDLARPGTLVSDQADQVGAHDSSRQNDKVGVTGLPQEIAVKQIKDDMDRKIFYCTIVLTIVGVLGTVVALWTLFAIRKQAKIMDEHRLSLEQLATAAQANANAANKNAEFSRVNAEATHKAAEAAEKNIELIIRKERARLTFEIGQTVQFTVGAPLYVTFTVRHDGSTSAFNVESETNAIACSSIDGANSDFLKLSINGLTPVVPPSFGTKLSSAQVIQMGSKWSVALDEETFEKIKRKQLYLHFWGFIRYTDFFDIPRETTFRYRWIAYEDPDFIEYWEPYGAPEDNHQT